MVFDATSYTSESYLGQGFSSHWVPYWKVCTPCHFKYDMIGKLDTGFDDFTVRFDKFFAYDFEKG